MLVSPVQPLNAKLTMLVTLAGIVMLVSPVQPLNAKLTMHVTLAGIVMLVRLVQPLNAKLTMLVTLAGIVKLVRLVQPLNASSNPVIPTQKARATGVLQRLFGFFLCFFALLVFRLFSPDELLQEAGGSRGFLPHWFWVSRNQESCFLPISSVPPTAIDTALCSLVTAASAVVTDEVSPAGESDA